MAKLVEEDVVYQVLGEEEEETGEVDHLFARTTAPTCACTIDLYGLIDEAVTSGKRGEACGEEASGLAPQGVVKDGVEAGLYVLAFEGGAGRAKDGEYAVSEGDAEAFP
jgi:hypothetical protein